MAAWGSRPKSLEFPADIPSVIKSLRQSGHGVSLTWASIPQRTYRVQYRESVSTALWQDVSEDVGGAHLMPPPIIRRPATLQEVARESRTYAEFGYNVKDFLHEFALAEGRELPLEPLLSGEPTRLAGHFEEGIICDAFLAATADYLARTHRFQTPAWALKEDLMLEHPWFSEEFPEVRLLLLRATPSAFKDKNLFVFETALTVA